MGALISSLVSHTVRLPFASARIGRRARTVHDWRMSGYGHPLAGNRSLKEMASFMYHCK
jgi:hypothetical protein